MSSPAWKLQRGATPLKQGGVHFRVWAPYARSVAVKVTRPTGGVFPMESAGEGVYEVTVPSCAVGDDYLYVLNGNMERPDPVSRFQPFGVHKPSRIIDPGKFEWTDLKWAGIPLKSYIIYELHVGTFTPEGTFQAAASRLSHLQTLGVTAIELMPITAFPGDRNWGYDTTYPYAPHVAYGGPYELKSFINACHEMGLAVILDFVCNHLGPEGNYLGDFGPYFSDRYKTPWGLAVNFDGPHSGEVRRYFTDSALHWLTEYHIDALRLDAVNAIVDLGAYSILQELTDAFHREAEKLHRQAFIIAESDMIDVRLINPPQAGGYGIDSQWSDDLHYSLHTILTGSKQDAFADAESLTDLYQSLTAGFVYDWKFSYYRQKYFGSTSTCPPGEKFVLCLQNHDQIANTCHGHRLGSLVALEADKLACCLLFFAPNIPLLFMGQEWRASSPFYYFTSFEDSALAEKVSKGRRREFQLYDTLKKSYDCRGLAPFTESKLDWSEKELPLHSEFLLFMSALIDLRRRITCLNNCDKTRLHATYDEANRWMVLHRRDAVNAAQALLIANLSETAQEIAPLFPKGVWQLSLDSSAKSFGGLSDKYALSHVSTEECTLPASLMLPGQSALIYIGLPPGNNDNSRDPGAIREPK